MGRRKFIGTLLQAAQIVFRYTPCLLLAAEEGGVIILDCISDTSASSHGVVIHQELNLLMVSRANLGLLIALSAEQNHRKVNALDRPVNRLHRDLFVYQPAAFLEDKVTALRLATVTCSECGYELALGVGEKRIRQLFLLHIALVSSKMTTCTCRFL